MTYQNLGRTDIQLPPITFGGNVLGWTTDEKMSFRLLDELLERGFNFIDSANVYSKWIPGNKGGESETMLGNWMAARKNRDKVLIATKVGMLTEDTEAVLSPENITKQIEASLKRLQTDYIDVYFSHTFEDHTPIQDTMQTYDKLIRQGKVRTIGASNFPIEKLKASQQIAADNNLTRYEVFQPEYHLMARKTFEADYQKYCIDEEISVTSYMTLASGFLTGKYQSLEDTEGSSRQDKVKEYFTDKGHKVLKALGDVSEMHKVSEAAVTLAWTMAQPGITSPIASGTKPQHLQSFYEALQLQLAKEDLQRLNAASS